MKQHTVLTEEHMNKLRSETALQSYMFAKAMEERGFMINPNVHISVFSKGMADNHEYLPEHLPIYIPQHSTKYRPPYQETEEIQKRVEEDKALGQTSFCLSTDSAGVGSKRRFDGSFTNEMIPIRSSLISINDERDTFQKEFAAILGINEEDIFAEETFDNCTWVFDHEFTHAAITQHLLEEAVKKDPKTNMHALQTIHEDREYHSFREECAADLFSILSAIHDGADPKKTLETVCALRSLALLNNGDIEHFTTPFLQQFSENLEAPGTAIEVREQFKAKLMESVLNLSIKENAQNANISYEKYQEIKESCFLKDSEKDQTKEPSYYSLFQIGLNMNHLDRDMANTITPAEAVKVITENPEKRETHLGWWIEKYIEPYAHVVHTKSDIEQGLVEIPTLTNEVEIVTLEDIDPNQNTHTLEEEIMTLDDMLGPEEEQDKEKTEYEHAM